MTTPAVVVDPVAVPRRRGFGITSLVLGILLVVGVALWMFVGATLFPALVWVFPIVLGAALVIAVVHVVVAAIALVFGILALVKDRGRVSGIVGLVLTVLATAALVLVGVFFAELVGVLYPSGVA